MKFPEFLKTRAGNVVGYTVLGFFSGAILFPFFFLLLIRIRHYDILVQMTGSDFFLADLQSGLVGAGLGAIRGLRYGLSVSGMLGLVLGLLAAVVGRPLGLYRLLLNDASGDVSPLATAILVAVCGVAGLIIGAVHRQEEDIRKQSALEEIRRKSRRLY